MRTAHLALAAALAAGKAGCAPSEIGDLEPLDVVVQVVGTTTVTPARPRISAFLVGQGGIAPLADRALTSTRAPIHLTLQPPPAGHITNRLLQARLGTGNGLLLVEPIRFALYDDLDGTAGFQDGMQVLGPDRILAIDEPPRGYGWVPQLEQQLAVPRPPTVSAYYALTGDRYTAFVPLFRPLDGTVALDASTTSVSVDISQAALAPTRLACGQGFSSPRTEDILHLQVDDALDADALCGLEVADCSAVRIEELDPRGFVPSPPTGAHGNITIQCRRRGALETVVIETNRRLCRPADCVCERFTETHAVLTATTAPPSWWPCGDTIPYCASSRPLYRTDPPCRTDEP